MRREELFLLDIVQAAVAIERSVVERSFADFLADDNLRHAILMRLIIIGEAARHLSASARERYPEIAWRDMIRFRDRAVHAYFAVDWSIVWETATEDVPFLRNQVADFIARDYPHLVPTDPSP